MQHKFETTINFANKLVPAKFNQNFIRKLKTNQLLLGFFKSSGLEYNRFIHMIN